MGLKYGVVMAPVTSWNPCPAQQNLRTSVDVVRDEPFGHCARPGRGKG
jgi:hypothetical protein